VQIAASDSKQPANEGSSTRCGPSIKTKRDKGTASSFFWPLEYMFGVPEVDTPTVVKLLREYAQRTACAAAIRIAIEGLRAAADGLPPR
jgi:hypothetical protein